MAFVAVFGVVDFSGGFLAIDRQPAGFDQHLARGFERVALGAQRHGADARGDLVFGSGEKHGDKAAHHKVIELLLGIGQAAGRF